VGGSPFAAAPAAQFSPASDNPYQSPSTYVGLTVGWDGSAGFELAGRWARLAGAIIDGLISIASVVPAYVFLFVATANNRRGASAMTLAFLPLLLGGLLAVSIVQWVLITKSGQSLGKKALGTRIVRIEDGQLPGFVKGVILRGWLPFLLRQICGLFSLVDACWIFGEERRCVHDLIANTRVVVAR
jgi:uncharacterized RDD family membrane protein YckC